MDDSELQGMLDDIDNNGTGLTNWEAEFVDSMLKKETGFTEVQANKIKQIFESKVGK